MTRRETKLWLERPVSGILQRRPGAQSQVNLRWTKWNYTKSKWHYSISFSGYFYTYKYMYYRLCIRLRERTWRQTATGLLTGEVPSLLCPHVLQQQLISQVKSTANDRCAKYIVKTLYCASHNP